MDAVAGLSSSSNSSFAKEKDHDSEPAESSDEEYEMQLNGKKFSVTKTTLRGTYAFTFIRDAEFLAKSKEEQTKFISLQL